MYLGQRYINPLIQHSRGSLSKRPAWPTEEFQVDQDYTEKPWLKKTTKTSKQWIFPNSLTDMPLNVIGQNWVTCSSNPTFQLYHRKCGTFHTFLHFSLCDTEVFVASHLYKRTKDLPQEAQGTARGVAQLAERELLSYAKAWFDTWHTNRHGDTCL